MRRLDLTGQRFGSLTVLAPAGVNRQRNVTWLCLCDCGNETTVAGGKLRYGTTRSCGLCVRRKPRPGARAAVVSYRAAHKRIERARGRATEHACSCGDRAAQWAYDGTDPNELTERGLAYSLDVMRYVPMCVPCHTAFDRRGVVAA